MSLHIMADLEQGSESWLEARRGIITASIVGQLITPNTIKPANNPISRALTMQLAAERITGYTESTYVSDDMFRGVEDEPRAIDAYEQHYGVQVESCGLMVRDFDHYKIAYSPDGLVGDDGLIEVKSRRPKKHLQTILDGEVPAENMAQCQAALLVSGRKWLDFVSYCGGLHLWVKRVEPDEKWFVAIRTVAFQFERTAGLMFSTYEARTLGMPLTERTFDADMVI